MVNSTNTSGTSGANYSPGYTDSSHTAPPGSTYGTGYPVANQNELAHAFRYLLNKMANLAKWMGWMQPQPWHPSPEQIRAIRINALYKQVSAFYPKLEQLMKRAHSHWNLSIKKELVNLIRDFLKQPTLEKEDRLEHQARIEQWLAIQLPAKARQESLKALGWLKKADPSKADTKPGPVHKEPKEKQAPTTFTVQKRAEQFTPNVSIKKFLFNASTAPWDKMSLCVFGTYALIGGATGNATNATGVNQQAFLLMRLNNTIWEPLEALSAAFSNPRQGANNLAITCGDRSFRILTEDPVKGIFDMLIQNETVAIPQYLAVPYTAVNATGKGAAPKLAKLTGNQAIFAMADGSAYRLIYTNASGKFALPGLALDSFAMQNPVVPSSLSFTNGALSVLENTGNNRRVLISQIGTSGPGVFFTLQTNIVNFNNQTIDPGVINELDGPSTPQISGKPITLIAPANNRTTAALITANPTQGTVNSSRVLPAPVGGAVGKPIIAHCFDNPDIFVSAREGFDAMLKRVIMFDVLNGTSSIIGGEQTYSNVNSSNPLQVQAGCGTNGNCIITYLEDGRPVVFTFNYLDSSVNAPTPTPTPTPTPVVPNGLSVNITIPTNISNDFIPITPSILTFTNNTATLTFTDANGWQLVFSGNLSAVPLNTTFYDPYEIYNISFKNINASGSPFEFKACDSQGNCIQSTAQHPLSSAYSTRGVNLAIVLPVVFSILLLIGGSAAGWYVKVELPRSRERREKYPAKDRADTTEEDGTRSLTDGEKYLNMNNVGR